MKKFALGTLAYALITMLIAAPWHFILFKDLYHGFGIYNRADPNVPLGFISMIVQGAVMACIYPGYAKDNAGYKNAVSFSLLMGLFLFSVSTLANAAKIEIANLEVWLGIQAVFHFVQFVACGFALGFVYSRK